MTQVTQDGLSHQGLTVGGETQKQKSAVPPASLSAASLDSGIACLFIMARLHGVAADAERRSMSWHLTRNADSALFSIRAQKGNSYHFINMPSVDTGRSG